MISAAQLAKVMNGPFLPVPAGSKWSLEELREVRWGLLSPAEQGEMIFKAECVLKWLYNMLLSDSTVEQIAAITQPTWFEGITNGSHVLDNYPYQHLKMQREAQDRVQQAVSAVFDLKEKDDGRQNSLAMG